MLKQEYYNEISCNTSAICITSAKATSGYKVLLLQWNIFTSVFYTLFFILGFKIKFNSKH